MPSQTIGTPEEHLAARLELLQAEKELTRRSDELARQRRQLPWVVVDKEYVFDTADGPLTLRELADIATQLATAVARADRASGLLPSARTARRRSG